ncbi:methylisocitrate lyase [Solemya velum gill symbiont]|uniref:methylisocitrate lyase n=1 Tax=Solemya velum gill symbiont TaxID=2340 RepID=UPI0009962D78|nr:methylisocitrate lyase [Solemya velum gill symbiont]OOY52175.1 methylisocitrate lyase [Solemya velum gill symbiont]OOY56431.1 methylisocitrate lyase [Solemya velum gill symbiont]OOY57851.1 methylisocitrate lyase [Solemya velum gill symbiont]OOY60387.1 methylisocitrate lyase [Solemya velum gill symbiont]OOY61513.1 methylisocitrate lyase [Solemya velum gill symbiont]
MTDTNLTPGAKLRRAVEEDNPLQVVGAVNAYSAIMAEKVGHKAIYLSGGGVAACSMGIPDLGITTMKDVLEDVNRITDASSLPLLVDVDAGWGGAFNIARCTREMIRSGTAGMHIEDQVMQKRCGHRPNKAIVTQEEMVDRVKAAVDAKSDESFVVMARTDALAVEGMESAVERAIACVEAGADMIFPEAINTLEQYKEFTSAVNVPVLANITEFGATPLFTTEELASAGVKLALYPLSAFRAMSLAALKVYQELLSTGTQQGVVDTMQTRMELYDFLDYHSYEHKLDQLFAEQKEE